MNAANTKARLGVEGLEARDCPSALGTLGTKGIIVHYRTAEAARACLGDAGRVGSAATPAFTGDRTAAAFTGGYGSPVGAVKMSAPALPDARSAATRAVGNPEIRPAAAAGDTAGPATVAVAACLGDARLSVFTVQESAARVASAAALKQTGYPVTTLASDPVGGVAVGNPDLRVLAGSARSCLGDI